MTVGVLTKVVNTVENAVSTVPWRMDIQSFAVSLIISCLIILQETTAKRDLQLYCGACQALVDEIQYAIGEVDPLETLEMGFRIDPQGRQKVKKIPYAGSEVHLMELLDDVCSKMKDYAESTDPETKLKKYVRFNARKEGDPVELTNVSINRDISKSLEVACRNIVEEYEEEIVQTFTAKEPNLKTQICNDVAEVCSGPAEVNSEKTEL
ncbi:protein canopy homolog 2-like isoform X1 [Patiria miniata]|uniref:Saposin B-type domain-containing protein n=2 Tax=Patiria miniata TaxID=46514 RepID=A0A914A3C1_PATMI|nr:protein canopy homolog 2-like isoform X1 [Patiria miniata]